MTDNTPTLEQRVTDLEQENEQLRTEKRELELRIEALEQRMGDLEDEQTKDQEVRKDLAGKAAAAEDTAKEAKEIAKAASATANQAKADVQGDARDETPTPDGVEPASSPLDFFANCRQIKLRRRLVERYNQKNDFRAVLVAKRWDEFATSRRDGSTVFWTRDDLREALTAILGEKPHGQTISRVWESLLDLGGDEIREKRRRVSSRQEPTQILELDRDVAEGLHDCRYHEFDLLDESLGGRSGVTPVVTDQPTASA